MLLTKPLTTLLSSSLAPPLTTLLLLTPTGHILSAASALPSSLLRARATLALQIWALYASNPSLLPSALPNNTADTSSTSGETTQPPPAVTSVAVHLTAGTLVIRVLTCGLLVCGLSSPPPTEPESSLPLSPHTNAHAHARTDTPTSTSSQSARGAGGVGGGVGLRPHFHSPHFLAPGSPPGVPSSAASEAGSVGTAAGRKGGRELAVLRRRVEEVGKWLDGELRGFAMSEGI